MSKDVKRINDIFHARIFRIPDYQRGYAWENKHRQAFWEDLELLLQIGSSTHHYTGLIALETLSHEQALSVLPAEDHWLLTGNTNLCMVVDGQQRLTTLIIFMHELLRRHAQLSAGLVGVLNATTRRSDAESRFVRKENLAVPGYHGYIFGYANNPDLDKFFRCSILDDESQITGGAPTSSYARQLNLAKLFFEQKFKSFDSTEQLTTWFELVESRLLFNVFEVQDEFDVCLTFEAMNNRGKALSDLEKLKSRFLYLAGLSSSKESDAAMRAQKLATYRRIVNDSWSKAYELLGWSASKVLEDDSFLQLAWVLRYGQPDGSRDTHLFLEQFTPKKAIQSDLWPAIDTFSRDLAALAAPWVAVTLPLQTGALFKSGLLRKAMTPEVVKWLMRLNKITATNFEPLLVAGLVHFQNQAISEADFLRLIQTIERYIYLVFGLSERPSHTGRNAYMREASRLYLDSGKLSAVVSRLEDELKWRFDPELFIVATKSRQVFSRSDKGFYGWGYLKYTLYEYENHFHESRYKRDDQKVTWDWGTSHANLAESVEHIYPQTPIAGEWPAFDTRNSEQRSLLLGSLGNLLLLSRAKNSSLKNSCFQNKAHKGDTRYANGSFSEIAVAQDFADWTPATIYLRSVELLHFMGQRWSIPNWEKTTKQLLEPLETLRFPPTLPVPDVHHGGQAATVKS